MTLTAKSPLVLRRAATAAAVANGGGGGGGGRRRHFFRRMVAAAAAPAAPNANVASSRARSQSPSTSVSASPTATSSSGHFRASFSPWRTSFDGGGGGMPPLNPSQQLHRYNSSAALPTLANQYRGGGSFSSCSQLSSSCENLHNYRHCSSNKHSNDPSLSSAFSRRPPVSSISLLRRRPSWIAAQSWSSGLDNRRPELEELEAFRGGGSGGGDGRSSVYGSALSLILGAGLIGASKEKDVEGDDERKREEEDDERLTPRSKRRKRREAEEKKAKNKDPPLLCRGIRLETVDLSEGEEKRDEEWPIQDDEEGGGEAEKDPEAWDGSVISVWKVGEREDVTEAEAREDGEHIIVKVEKCSCSSNNDDDKKKTEEEEEEKVEGKKRKRRKAVKCQVKAEEEQEEEQEEAEVGKRSEG